MTEPIDLDALIVDKLTPEDLDSISWSGNPAHIRSVAMQLERADVDYVAVRTRDGDVVAKGMIVYSDDAGAIEQLATRGELQGRGIGSRLIAEAERRIKASGRRYSVIGVEHGNDYARALYERLGYVAFDNEQSSWEVEDEDGTTRIHYAEVTLMRKEL